ncbi:MAG: TraR/DksA family transcriptional regulator [Acidimicrobiales bacterium]
MDSVGARLEQARVEALVLISDLEADLAAIAESTAESPDDEHDAEGSTVGYERARVGSLLDQARKSLADIDGAIERERQGTYGVCTVCGSVIAAERLEALATTTVCIACAERPDR